MVANPEEGRLSDEAYAERLQESIKRTVQMRRQYRDMRDEEEAKTKAGRWLMNHRDKHEEVDKEMTRFTMQFGPQNRRVRRAYAKRMNAFKIPGGWQRWSRNYQERFGHQESVSTGARQMRKQERATRKNSIVDAIAKGE